MTWYLDSKQLVSIMTLTQMTTNRSSGHPFEPLPPVEPVTHTPLEVKLSLHLTLKDSCKFMIPYTAHLLHKLVMTSNCHSKMCHPQTCHITTGRKFNVATRMNEKVMKLQKKSDVVCKNILQHIGCIKIKN